MLNNYVQNLLGENERILLTTRQHWFVLVSAIIGEIALSLLIVVGVSVALIQYPAAAFGYLLALVPLVSMLRDILVWRGHEYFATNRRVIQVSGLFNKHVVDSSLEKVNDVKMNQTWLGRIFDYGDIEILTASEIGVNLFKKIGAPVKFKTVMLNAKEGMGHDETGVKTPRTKSIPALIAELDELRKQGVVTEAEFQQKKKELLAKM